jgi:hypothetical protein
MIVKDPIPFPAEAVKIGDPHNETAYKDYESRPESRPAKELIKTVHVDAPLCCAQETK